MDSKGSEMCRAMIFSLMSIHLSGCNVVEKVYTWESNEDKGKYTVRVNVTENGQVNLNETVKYLDKSDDTHYLYQFTDCQIIDANNWSCNSPIWENGYVQMSNGKLTQLLENQEREYDASWQSTL